MDCNTQIEQTLKPLAHRGITFLSEDMGIEVLEHRIKIEKVSKLDLMAYTSMLGIGGAINQMFVMSFDNNTMTELAKRFVYGEIDESEMEVIKQESACEIANIIIGNAIVNFPNKGKGVTFTPPVTIEYGKTILKSKNSRIGLVHILTIYGVIVLAIIVEE